MNVSLGIWHSALKEEQMATTQPKSYVFKYDRRYYAVKFGPPTLAKLSLRGGQHQHERIEIPRVGTGTKSVRLKGP